MSWYEVEKQVPWRPGWDRVLSGRYETLQKAVERINQLRRQQAHDDYVYKGWKFRVVLITKQEVDF